MVFQIEPHMTRAHQLMSSGDAYQLQYACLELRFALERIAYQTLQLRLDKITADEIGAWQPRRAMERLMELADPHLTRSSILRFAPQAETGEVTGEFRIIAQRKGIDPRGIGKHWQKLSSFLHIPGPKAKGAHPPALEERSCAHI
jgi:hypothetical protein